MRLRESRVDELVGALRQIAEIGEPAQCPSGCAAILPDLAPIDRIWVHAQCPGSPLIAHVGKRYRQTRADLDLAFEFIDVDEPDAELITNAAVWKR